MSACAAVALMLPVAGARAGSGECAEISAARDAGEFAGRSHAGAGTGEVVHGEFFFCGDESGRSGVGGIRAVVPDDGHCGDAGGETGPGGVAVVARQMFCMHVTDIKIAAGRRWKHTEEWKFSVADVKDGKYRATATFVATKQTATAEFEAAWSVQ